MMIHVSFKAIVHLSISIENMKIIDDQIDQIVFKIHECELCELCALSHLQTRF